MIPIFFAGPSEHHRVVETSLDAHIATRADGGVTPAVGPGLRIDVLNRPRDAVVVAEARLAPADAVLVVLRAAKLRLDLRTMVCGLRTR